MAFPPLPSSFWGTVKLGGANVAPGTTVSAWINGVKYAETTVSQPASDTLYGLNVPGEDPAEPGTQGGVEGDTVVFKIGELEVNQTGTWHSGTNVELNLTASGGGPTDVTLPSFAAQSSAGGSASGLWLGVVGLTGLAERIAGVFKWLNGAVQLMSHIHKEVWS